jgi:hypothetical protein
MRGLAAPQQSEGWRTRNRESGKTPGVPSWFHRRRASRAGSGAAVFRDGAAMAAHPGRPHRGGGAGVAARARQVSSNISAANEFALQTGELAGRILQAAQDLSRQAVVLQNDAAGFIGQVKAG